MEEAKFSFNVKFLVNGYECCFTMREDAPDQAPELVNKAFQVISYLSSKGAAPTRIPAPAKPAAPPVSPSVVEQANALFDNVPAKSAHPVPKPAAAAAPVAVVTPPAGPLVCPKCGQSDQVELIHFVKNGKPKSAYKCQRCQEWQR
jgi:hypothetical protein